MADYEIAIANTIDIAATKYSNSTSLCILVVGIAK